MVCPHCGRELPDTSTYCDGCGAFLGEEGAASASTANPSQGLGGGSGATPGGYVRHYEPIDTTGPDSTDTMRPVTPVDPIVAGQTYEDDPFAEDGGANSAGPRGLDGAAGIRDKHTDEQDDLPNDDRTTPAAIVVALILGVAAIALFVLLIRSCSPQTSDEGDAGAAAVTEAATSSAADTEAKQESSSGEVEVRATLSDYSWGELSKISAKIADAQNYADASQIAIDYHLLNDDGTYPDTTKTIELADGSSCTVRLADICHDDRADGTGKAGLTFVAASVGATHRLEAENSNAGGWASSEMRSWMNSDTGLLGELPDELADNIVEVEKLTNNTGHSTSTDCVTATSDALWLLSLQELAGDVNWSWASDPNNSSAYNAIMNAEGSQYELFYQHEIDNYYPNAYLQLTDATGANQTWWLRSPSVSVEDHFRKVNKDGDPSQFDDPSIPYGVVFGFCL